uniref:Uncharacterized protein n=1 Tax=Timema shepardi TaxID=629360 RepID=A0A7R9FZM8_TIMSH|nr:unnamed protein product [Timema shepardi]
MLVDRLTQDNLRTRAVDFSTMKTPSMNKGTFLSLDLGIRLPSCTLSLLLVHATKIRTSISPSSAVELNTTSALANHATEAEIEAESPLQSPQHDSLLQVRHALHTQFHGLD